MATDPTVPVPINFVLSHLESATTLSQLATVYNQDAMTPIASDARAVIYVKEADAKAIFKIRTDAADVIDADSSDIEFYTFDDAFTALAINPADAMMNKPESNNPIALADKSGASFEDNKSLLAHDFVRHLADDLFGSYLGVDIFNNELALIQNIRTKCSDSDGNVMDVINASVKQVSVNSESTTIEGLAGSAGAKYMTNANATAENLCRELFNQMISANPARFANLDGTSSDTEPRSLPFIVGDSLNFKLTVNPAEGQHVFIRGEEGEAVAARSYEIRLFIVSDTDAEKVNTAVADDEASA